MIASITAAPAASMSNPIIGDSELVCSENGTAEKKRSVKKMLIDKLVLIIMAAIVFVPVAVGLIYYHVKGDKMDIYTQCFDCKHFGKDCMDMVGDEPACDCYEPREREGEKDETD